MRTHRRLMLQWIAGNIEECWREGLRIEQERAHPTKKGQRPHQHDVQSAPTDTRAPLIPKNPQIERRKQKNAKRLINIGEYSRAISALLSNGTAPITEDVLAQLKSKHPRRTNPVTRPCLPTSQHDPQADRDDDDWDTLLPSPPSDSESCPGSPRTQCTHPNNHTNWLHERDHRTRKGVEMDIDTHGGLPIPQSRNMDMDPDPTGTRFQQKTNHGKYSRRKRPNNSGHIQ